LATCERARDAAERFGTRRERIAYLLHASAVDQRRKKRRCLTLITIGLHAVGPQRVDDDQDDVPAMRSANSAWIRGAKSGVMRGYDLTSRRRLEGKAFRSEEAREELVLPVQIV